MNKETEFEDQPETILDIIAKKGGFGQNHFTEPVQTRPATNRPLFRESVKSAPVWDQADWRSKFGARQNPSPQETSVPHQADLLTGAWLMISQ